MQPKLSVVRVSNKTEDWLKDVDLVEVSIYPWKGLTLHKNRVHIFIPEEFFFKSLQRPCEFKIQETEEDSKTGCIWVEGLQTLLHCGQTYTYELLPPRII